MSDVTIGQEGKATTDGRFILPGALVWDEQVPVCVNSPEGAWVVGTATMRREPDGKLVATIELLPQTMTFDVSGDDWEMDGDLLVVKAGALKTIYIGGKTPWEPPKEQS